MGAASTIKYLYLSFLSSPSAERQLYRAVKRLRAKRIVEVGLQQGRRSTRLLQVARRYHPRAEIHYLGIDLFEMRPADQPSFPLKQAHQLLRPLAGNIQLLPGDPHVALTRGANSMVDSDLIVLSADQDTESLRQAWFYGPRMLHERTEVFLERTLEQSEKTVYRRLTRSEIHSLAESAEGTWRRAA